MNLSATLKLTSYFTLLFGFVVVVLAMASYTLESYEVYAKIDDSLHVAIGATSMSTEHELNEHPTMLGGEEDLQSVLSDSHSPSLADTQILVLQGLRAVAHKEGQLLDMKPLRPLEIASSHPQWGDVRVAHETIDIPKFGVKFEIYAAKSIRPALARLQQLRRILFGLVPLGLALAAFLGYLLARRALMPLSELTRTIDQLSSTDLTARVTVAKYEDEIGQVSARFNALLDRLEAAFSNQRRFMTDASHELRTPVAVALTAAQVATRGRQRRLEDCEESLEVIEEQMLRLKRTIQDMFFLAQADSSSLALRLDEMFLDDAISEAARAANTLTRPKQQSLKVSELIESRCLGDEALLKQAILILLDNAIKYTPRHGKIKVDLERRQDFWICSVCNDGVGITPAAQERIFERFYRDNQPSLEKVAGSGLGLAIAKSIAEGHGGTLTLVESRPGYTCFALAIPVFAAESIPEATQANSLAVKI